MTKLFIRIEILWKKSTAIAILLIVIGIGLAIWTSIVPQSPGVSIGLLALIAGIMSIRPEMHIVEKIAWLCLLGTFAYLEIHAIKRNDEESRITRDRQNQEFSAIATEMQHSIDMSKRQYASTLSHVDRVMDKTEAVSGLAQESLENITGGKSYAVLLPDLATIDEHFPLIVVNRGTNILNGVTVMMASQGVFWPATEHILLDAVNKKMQVGTLHPHERTVLPQQLQIAGTVSPNDPIYVYVYLTAQNGTYTEYLRLRTTGQNNSMGKREWQYCYDLYRGTPGQRKQELLERSPWTSSNDPKLK